MITIKREDTKMVITIDPGMSDEKVAALKWDCHQDWYAELLVDRCSDQLYNKLRQIRREAYERGWKDRASRKTKKETDFLGYW